MIKSGHAYMDNTEQEKMQAERMERKESINRNKSVEDNLAWFEKLLRGNMWSRCLLSHNLNGFSPLVYCVGEKDAQSYCLRAKIDMTSVNGTMRDPVLYRY
jgi:glutamyl/glutaminyl-tRNA synthetase